MLDDPNRNHHDNSNSSNSRHNNHHDNDNDSSIAIMFLVVYSEVMGCTINYIICQASPRQP